MYCFTNMSLLGGTSKLLTDVYDYGRRFYKPIEGIKATKPFVIIDEPHRFSKTQKAYEFIEKIFVRRPSFVSVQPS